MKYLKFILQKHSRGIAESHILLACHLFHKLHNLGGQRYNCMCTAAFSFSTEIIMQKLNIKKKKAEKRHTTYIVKPLCLIWTRLKTKHESFACVKICWLYFPHPSHSNNMTSVLLITQCERIYERITDCIVQYPIIWCYNKRKDMQWS